MRLQRHSRREPTIALINIVFLMLVFFLVAGTIAPPLERDLSLVTTANLPPDSPPDALVLHADGRMTWRGEALASAGDYVGKLKAEDAIELRVVPDRNVPATDLIRLAEELRAAGAQRVMIVTEKALQ